MTHFIVVACDKRANACKRLNRVKKQYDDSVVMPYIPYSEIVQRTFETCHRVPDLTANVDSTGSIRLGACVLLKRQRTKVRKKENNNTMILCSCHSYMYLIQKKFEEFLSRVIGKKFLPHMRIAWARSDCASMQSDQGLRIHIYWTF